MLLPIACLRDGQMLLTVAVPGRELQWAVRPFAQLPQRSLLAIFQMTANVQIQKHKAGARPHTTENFVLQVSLHPPLLVEADLLQPFQQLSPRPEFKDFVRS
jgi:hypothetical protein